VSSFWQTVILATLPVLVAGRVAITRTGRLRKVIRANVELLGKLPADDPTREALAAHVRELVDVLAWREYQQFHPLASSGPSFRVVVPLTVAGLLWGVLLLAGLTGAYRPESPSPTALWLVVALYAALTVATVGLTRSAAKLDRQQRRLLQQVLPADAEPAR
jgi:hypothetical protein